MEQEQNQDVVTPNTQPAQDLPTTGQQETDKEALVDAALACVRWDESVDLDRLMVLEFKHNLGLLTSGISWLPSGARPGSCQLPCLVHEHQDATLGAYYSMLRNHGYTGPEGHGKPADLGRHDDGTWSINRGERINDAQLAGLLAVCARHATFLFIAGPSEKVGFAHTWLARAVEGLAQRAAPWTGIEIMRTRNLCIALAALLDAREKDGPLGRVDVPKCDILDQGAVPSACRDADDDNDNDGDLAVSMHEALTRARQLVQGGLVFSRHTMTHESDNNIGAADHTRRLLAAVQSGVDRLYATEPYFIKMIAPSEYGAMVAEAPLAATFFH
ncbi:hypothetical protein pqer_cds_1004 [Pandoravirus quercus]|uniref:Uncharacterized protein n=1 Tax=Pandoravirus quercus TaxID=2107709 RepID=A0A2U7UAH7_9VIRU|nr:hypothetical protein pqer_cds_1004 [Pandoravirus quercus]AVK75426.1 hypothetical protein pqer_cds_1004 [Pandoravirus quercus]